MAKESQFSKVNVGNIVLINKQILFEIIEKRIYENGVKIDDLFLLCKAPQGEEGEQLVDTPYGKLRVFFLKNGWKGRTWLLNKKKYPYPKVSKVSGRLSHAEHVPLNVFEKPFTDAANDALKKEYKIN